MVSSGYNASTKTSSHWASALRIIFAHLALVSDERHQLPVTPGYALVLLGQWNLFAPRTIDVRNAIRAPWARSRLRRSIDRVHDRRENLRELAESSGGVQIERFQRAHERPAQAEAVFYRAVQVFHIDTAVFDEAHRFARDQALQPVHDKSGYLFFQHDRRLPGGAQQCDRARNGISIREGSG